MSSSLTSARRGRAHGPLAETFGLRIRPLGIRAEGHRRGKPGVAILATGRASTPAGHATQPRRPRRVCLVRLAATIVVMTALALAIVPRSATAGTYAVWSCTSPTGGAAPANWAPSAPTRTEDACGGGADGSRYFFGHAHVPVNFLDGRERYWIFAAPPGMALRGGALWWSGANPDPLRMSFRATARGARALWTCDGTLCQVLDEVILLAHGSAFGRTALSDRLGDDNREWLPAFNRPTLFVTVECEPFTTDGACDGYMYVYRSMVIIEENNPPSGQLDNTPPTLLRGPVGYPLHAEDIGAGVWEARARVDGQVVAREDLDRRAQCSDHAPGNSMPYDVVFKVPCAGSGNTTLSLDTLALKDGEHRVQVEIVDAAGNTKTIYDESVTVDNLTPAGEDGPAPSCYFRPEDGRWFNPAGTAPVGTDRPNGGAPTSADAVKLSSYLPVRRTVRRRGRKRRVTIRHTRRTVGYFSRPTLRGRVRDNGRKPIADTAVYVATRHEGGQWCLDDTPVKTSRTGRFSLKLPARRPTREVAVLLFPSSGSNHATMSRALQLRVRSGVTLRRLPRRVRNRHRIAFRGNVHGAIPERGAFAVVQVRDRGRWRTFRSFRIGPRSRGRYAIGYRFQRSRGLSYRFRVFVPRQTGRPFMGGASRAYRVSVR